MNTAEGKVVEDILMQGLPVVVSKVPVQAVGAGVSGVQGFPVRGSNLVVHEAGAVVVVPDVESAMSFARVRAPTNPVPPVSPAGVRVSLFHLFWNLMTARAVAGPK
mgnify:CR=1 FL=1